MEQSKKCTKCGTEKALSEFYRNKTKKDGYRSSCKSCERAYYEANKEGERERQRAYYEANKDKVLERNKAHYKANKEYLSEKKRAYYEANKDKIKERGKAYYEANKERKKAYEEANKERRNEAANAYQKKRRKQDTIYRLKHNLRTRLSIAIKSKGYSKNTKTADTLGCSWEFLKEYLEAQFVDGMTWGNYGEWHIDHIKPLALAKTEEEVYNLNHYTNLQPLWAEDNMRKKDNIDYKQFRLL